MLQIIHIQGRALAFDAGHHRLDAIQQPLVGMVIFGLNFDIIDKPLHHL